MSEGMERPESNSVTANKTGKLDAGSAFGSSHFSHHQLPRSKGLNTDDDPASDANELIEAMRSAGVDEAAIVSTVARMKTSPVGGSQINPSLTESPFPGVQRAFLRKKEFAYSVGVSVRTMERWMADGVVQSVKIGSSVFIPVSELARHQELAAA